jgi:hypothetical protein
VIRTDPRRISPPLPDVNLSVYPETGSLQAEIRRAAHELMYALHRQRTAWARLVQVKAEYGERNISFIDNERPYKEALGDVQWWRGEVSSRANAALALIAIADRLERLLEAAR